LETLNQPSIYERAWKKLSVSGGSPYPSSGVFAGEVWHGTLTVALCEVEPRTAEEIDGWLAAPQVQGRLQHSVLLRGDWRSSLNNPDLLSSPAECIYVEMDPMRYDTRGPADRKTKDPASLYPNDAQMLGQTLAVIERPTVLHISSFSTLLTAV
jgi:hypothetical protein